MKNSVGGDGGFHFVLLYGTFSSYLQVNGSDLIQEIDWMV
jgi:hypothetical protein